MLSNASTGCLIHSSIMSLAEARRKYKKENCCLTPKWSLVRVSAYRQKSRTSYSSSSPFYIFNLIGITGNSFLLFTLVTG